MEPVALIVACWLLFGGTHVGLATRSVRTALVDRLGDGGFRLLYSAIAAVAFAVLLRTYALHAHEGPLGFGGFVGPGLRLVLWTVAALGATLMIAGLVAYPASPMEMATAGVPRPTRLARISRHAFFVGLAIVAAAHVVLATHATGTVFFAGLVLVDAIGAWHQDRKLLAQKGEAYATYCRETSIVPFAAIVAGRARMAARDVPLVPLAIGAAGAAAIRWVHPYLFAWDGMAVVVAVVGGAAFFGVTGLVRLAIRRGHGRELATAGAMLVLEVGLAHEIVGTRLYPDGPALVGGLLAWHAIGVAGIAIGLLMTGGVLGLTVMPPRFVATATMALGAAFIVLDVVVHGGFHFFAATLVVGAWLVRSGGVFERAVAGPVGAAAPGRTI
jgi:uncharacterized membrane protein